MSCRSSLLSEIHHKLFSIALHIRFVFGMPTCFPGRVGSADITQKVCEAVTSTEICFPWTQKGMIDSIQKLRKSRKWLHHSTNPAGNQWFSWFPFMHTLTRKPQKANWCEQLNFCNPKNQSQIFRCCGLPCRMADKSPITGSSRMESVQKTSKGTGDKSFFKKDFAGLPADILAAIKDLPTRRDKVKAMEI